MKRKRHLSGEVQVALDEFEREKVSVLTAIIMPVERLARFEREWAGLRQEMRRELLAHYPFAAEAKALADGGLPEIHAVDLFQSAGLFRNDPAARPGYWRKHREWLARAVTILYRARPQILTHRWRPEYTEFNVKVLGLPSQTFAQGIPFKNMRRKMDRLFLSPYVWTLNHTISYLEEHFAEHGLHGTLLCDEHEDGRGFSLLKTFDLVRGLSPHETHLPAPRFASSHEHALLQAADVACYVFGQVYYAEQHGKALDQDLAAWAFALMPLVLQGQGRSKRPYDWKKATARLFELMVAQSGGPMEYRQKLEAALPDFLSQVLTDGENTVMRLDLDGLFFGPEMYRPPSEDGDLSTDTLPPPDEEDQGDQEDPA